MKVTIEVKNRKEGEAIKAALAHELTRATVVATGILLGLETDRQRVRAIRYVMDHFDEEAARAAK